MKQLGGEEAVEWKEYFGGLPHAEKMVVRDPVAWKKLWERFSQAPVPKLNFKHFMAAAVFLGNKSTGGYEVHILGTYEKEGKLHIRYRETKPEGGFVIQAFTSPYHIKIFSRKDLPAIFEQVP